MNVCENEIRDAVEAELIAANEKYPPFASLHEAYAVILEEYEEADDELMACDEFIQDVWRYTKEDNTQGALEAFKYLKHRAEHLAQEACQMAAMANKAEQSFADKMNLENLK
jgi:hypothetical protein